MAHYSIKQLEIGFDAAFPAGIAFDMWNMAGESTYSPFSMTLIQGEGHNILFDCGFDPETAYGKAKIAQENDQNCHNTLEVLEANGISADDIDTVIISHCHWDHLQGLKYFKNAKRIVIQKDEYQNWLRAMADERFPVTHKLVIDTECLNLLKEWVECGKVELLGGDVFEFLPGISIGTAKGHSFCQNVLFINDEKGRYVVAGDAAMRPESFKGNEAFQCYLPNLKFSVGTIEDIISSYDRIMNFVQGDISHIVLAHDGTAPAKRETDVNGLGLRVFTVLN